MEPQGDSQSPPFWFQPPTAQRRRTQPNPLFNPVVLIIGIPILTLLILFFLLPPFLSHTSQILRPNSVKKSWDSLNILLVLFAIVCGVFARRNDEAPPSDQDTADHRNMDSVSNFVDRPRQFGSSWLDFPDRREYNSSSSSNVDGGGRLRRSSSSYPDLRQESVWENGGGGGIRPRVFDDFEVNFYRSPPPDNFEIRREAERKEVETFVREIPVDKFEVSSAPPPPTPLKSPTPPPPQPSSATLKRRRSLHSVPRKEVVNRHRVQLAEIGENKRLVPPPTPPPPPPPQQPEVSVKIHRKKNGATKEIATAIASLYKGERKRKKRVKSRDIYDNGAAQNSSPPSVVEPRSTPPPPPPPPPSNVLQNLFKKSGKNKRVHSVPTTTPPPAPPPPPNSIFNNLFISKSKRFQQPSTAAPPPPPPPPAPNSIFNNLFSSKSNRFQQPSTAAPPPPPPPPSSILNSLFKNGSKSRRFKNVINNPPPAPPPPPPVEPPRRRQVNSGKPPKPTKPSTPYPENVSMIAPPSPLIPPPPPPPPFKMREVEFVAQGDFVRIRSTHSSRCSSPELEDVDMMSVKSDGGDSVGPSISCPSPDVNVKADTFIARLKDEWRLEKMNSLKEKRIPG